MPVITVAADWIELSSRVVGHQQPDIWVLEVLDVVTGDRAGRRDDSQGKRQYR